MNMIINDSVIAQYKSSNAINQSAIKALLKGVHKYNKYIADQEKGGMFYADSNLYYKEKSNIVIGDAVDTMLTLGNDMFFEKFIVSDITKPGEKIMSIVQEGINQHELYLSQNPNMETYKSGLMDIINEHGYYPNWKDDTRWKKVLSQGTPYWNWLIKAKGKTIISKEELASIRDVVLSFKTHAISSKFFARNFPDFIDIKKQFPIYFKHLNTDCKGLLDIAIINHNAKTIQPIDMKVTQMPVLSFPRVVKQFRYDIQASFYDTGIKTSIVGTKLESYKVLPFQFLVESYTYPGQPVIYTCDPTMLIKSRIGFTMHTDRVRGWEELLEDYEYYKTHGFDIDIQIRETGNRIELTWN